MNQDSSPNNQEIPRYRATPVSEAPTQLFAAPRNRPPAAQPAAAAEEATQIWIPVPQPAARRRPNWLLRLVVGLALLLVIGLGAAAAVGGYLLYESSWIIPGASALGVDLGGQTRAEAEAALAAYWQRQSITLVSEEVRWQVAPAELGITLDAAATVAAAYRQGRSWASLQQGWRQGGFAVSPVWEIDMSVARSSLAARAEQLAVPPVDAGLLLVNGRFQATPATTGRALDLDATLADLAANAAQAVLSGQFALQTQTVPPRVSDVSGVVDEANALLTQPLLLRAVDPISDESWTWQLAPEVWGGWLHVDAAAAAAGRLEWALNTAQAGAYLADLVGALGEGRIVDEAAAGTAVADALRAGQPAVTLRIYHAPRQHTVQVGETLSSIGRAYGIPYPWIQQANPGVELLSVGQTLLIPSPDALIPLPVVENKRIVVSITQQRVRVYENGALKWDWAASTGIADSPTAPGVFQVQTHEPNAYAANWDLWMPSFMGIYRPVPTSEFMNGFHGFPTRDGSQLLWTGNLGQPVTYGCILISSANAELLYDWAETGVIVEIQS